MTGKNNLLTCMCRHFENLFFSRMLYFRKSPWLNELLYLKMNMWFGLFHTSRFPKIEINLGCKFYKGTTLKLKIAHRLSLRLRWSDFIMDWITDHCKVRFFFLAKHHCFVHRLMFSLFIVYRFSKFSHRKINVNVFWGHPVQELLKWLLSVFTVAAQECFHCLIGQTAFWLSYRQVLDTFHKRIL